MRSCWHRQPALAMTFADGEKTNLIFGPLSAKGHFFCFHLGGGATTEKRHCGGELRQSIVEQIRKTYAQLGSPANGYGTGFEGFTLLRANMGLIFEETGSHERMVWAVLESGKSWRMW